MGIIRKVKTKTKVYDLITTQFVLAIAGGIKLSVSSIKVSDIEYGNWKLLTEKLCNKIKCYLQSIY